ncbi:uncharacterized protein ACRADG_005644 isoform 2-T2 [Cochliomyia hominivorax]
MNIYSFVFSSIIVIIQLLSTLTDTAFTHPATDILECFLRESHPGDKSVTAQYFDVYKKCDFFKNNLTKEPFGDHQLEELSELGLPHNLEKYLKEKIVTGNKKEMKKGLIYVEKIMGNDVELSKEYKEYKYNILIKYKPKNVISFLDLNLGYLLRNNI